MCYNTNCGTAKAPAGDICLSRRFLLLSSRKEGKAVKPYAGYFAGNVMKKASGGTGCGRLLFDVR
jgi:hypothetical protein